MSIINNAHGENAYAVLQIIYEYINLNSKKVTKDNIIEYCAGPENGNLPAVSDESEKVVNRNISFWTETGLFYSEEGNYSIPDKYRVDDMIKLPNVLRKVLLCQDNNPNGVFVESNSSPLIRPLCAMLLLDIYKQPEGWNNRELKDEINMYFDSEKRVNNDDATGFEKIAKYLGFITNKGHNRFYIDPTQVIEDELPKIFHQIDELQFREFLARLVDFVPVFDGGAYWLETLEHMKRNNYNWTISKRQITTALSRTLLRLDSKGSLRLEFHSDGDSFELLGPSNRKIKEVTLVKFNREFES